MYVPGVIKYSFPSLSYSRTWRCFLREMQKVPAMTYEQFPEWSIRCIQFFPKIEDRSLLFLYRLSFGVFFNPKINSHSSSWASLLMIALGDSFRTSFKQRFISTSNWWTKMADRSWSEWSLVNVSVGCWTVTICWAGSHSLYDFDHPGYVTSRYCLPLAESRTKLWNRNNCLLMLLKVLEKIFRSPWDWYNSLIILYYC